jgi:Uma2 family endonuclease
MLAQQKQYLTPQEYLSLERSSDIKSEYFNGEVFAMSSASENHNLIVTNIISELRSQLKGRPCKVYPGDMRVKVSQTGLYTYPDVTALCGKAVFEDEYRDTLINPAVIIEVLSKSTEAYNRGVKFCHYRKLESLVEYVLVSQDKVLIEHYSRQSDNQWLLSAIDSIEGSVTLSSVQCTLALSEVYDKVEIEEAC